MESLLFTREDLKKLIVPLIIEQALALSIGLFDTAARWISGLSITTGRLTRDTVWSTTR